MPANFSWEICQKLSDLLLAEGLFLLREQQPVSAAKVTSQQAGNYLVSLASDPMYIGEAENLTSRLRQQFSTRSTFYKNYRNRTQSPFLITDFTLQYIETNVGRKELEEFGIANAECGLNKFQIGKRDRFSCASTHLQWDEVQRESGKIISGGQTAALSTESKPWLSAIATACAGLYIVRQANDADILYIGESSDIKERYDVHSTHTYFSALRRHVGTDLLGFSLKARNGKARYFSDDEDRRVTEFLCSCSVSCVPVSFGRFELEKQLIRKCRPLLNRKDAVNREH